MHNNDPIQLRRLMIDRGFKKFSSTRTQNDGSQSSNESYWEVFSALYGVRRQQVSDLNYTLEENHLSFTMDVTCASGSMDWTPGRRTTVSGVGILGDPSNKLLGIQKHLPELQDVLDAGTQSYMERLRFSPQFFYGQVHTFADERAQGAIVALAGKSPKQQSILVDMVHRTHLMDDQIDSGLVHDTEALWCGMQFLDAKKAYEMGKQIGSELAQGVETTQKWLEVQHPTPFWEAGLSDVSASVGNDGSYEGLNELLKYSATGAAVAQSPDKEEQSHWASRFKEHLLVRVEGTSLSQSILRLHPVQLQALTHVGMACFYAVEGSFHPALPVVYDCLYAPLLYCHDKIKEKNLEGNRLLIGGEKYIESGMLSDFSLEPLIDIWLNHHTDVEDDNRSGRYKQAYWALKSFGPVIDQMEQSLQNKFIKVKEIVKG